MHFLPSQDYPKLSQTYYVLLECLAQDHMSFLASLEPTVFLYILSSISEGLTALGANLNDYTGIVRTRPSLSHPYPGIPPQPLPFFPLSFPYKFPHPWHKLCLYGWVYHL